MSAHSQRITLLSLAVLFAVVVLVNLALAVSNRASQRELAERGQFIQQSVALERLNQEIIRALAELAVRNQDKDVTALLNANGVSFTVNAPATPAAPARGK